MRTLFASSGVRTFALAFLAVVASGGLTGCKDKRKKAPAAPPAPPPAAVWGGATTDDVVLHWRQVCGTDASAQRKGAEIQVNFKRDDGDKQIACSLNYRESNRDLLAATIIFNQTVPPATTYTQWAAAERLAKDLLVELLPEATRPEYTRVMSAKQAGLTKLGAGLTMQVVQGTADGMATIVVNVYVEPEAG